MAKKDYINTRQIAKFQTGKALLEFNDKLQPAEAEYASNLHNNYSKIHVVAIDYEKGKGADSIVADLNLDPETAKYLAQKILFHIPQMGDDGKPKRELVFYEEKILGHKVDENGRSRVTKFHVNHSPAMNYCWNVTVENGTGVPEKNTATGGTKSQKDSYTAAKTVKLNLDDASMKKVMLQLQDYIRTFEIVNFNPLMKVRVELEAKLKSEREAAANN